MAAPHASPSRQRLATTYAQHGSAGDEKIRRLQSRGRADQDAGEHGIRDPPRRQRADDEEHGGEHEHHRGEVRHRREPQRLREELLDPALVVATDEERDRGERRDHPQERRPVAEQPTADARRDPVDAQERQRAEDEHLREDECRAAPGRTSARWPR